MDDDEQLGEIFEGTVGSQVTSEEDGLRADAGIPIADIDADAGDHGSDGDVEADGDDLSDSGHCSDNDAVSWRHAERITDWTGHACMKDFELPVQEILNDYAIPTYRVCISTNMAFPKVKNERTWAKEGWRKGLEATTERILMDANLAKLVIACVQSSRYHIY